MPTAVGPNTKGEESLVFGYDLGDVSNSYKGEPTTPLRDTFPTDTTLPTGYHWTYEYDFEIVDAPVSGHFLSNQKWIKGVRDTTGSRRILFLNYSFTAGRTYTFSCYMYSNDSRLTSIAQVSHNGTYSSYQSGIEYTSADTGTVKRIHGTWVQQQNGSSIFGMQTNNAALGATFYMTGLQVEEKGHPTQLTVGTRSTTQGLIDLTGNSTIDLTNVSFDSNAQMTFDGTNDYIDLGDLGLGAGSFTVEAVIFPTLASTYHVFFRKGDDSTSNDNTDWSMGYDYDQFHVRAANASVAVNEYAGGSFVNNHGHVVLTYDGSTMRMYRDGTEVLNKAVTFANSYSNYSIGRGINNYAQLDVKSIKVYNKTLTASEIKANYNAIKGRFNI